MSSARPVRRRLLLGSAGVAEAVPAAAAGVDHASSGLLADCEQLHAVQQALPAVARAMDAAFARACDLEMEWHRLQDRVDGLLTAIEDCLPASPAEAAAKLQVATSLVAEGRDPGRHRFLAIATLQAESLQ